MTDEGMKTSPTFRLSSRPPIEPIWMMDRAPSLTANWVRVAAIAAPSTTLTQMRRPSASMSAVCSSTSRRSGQMPASRSK